MGEFLTRVTVMISGSVLLQTWRQLSTPNLASVLDVHHGVRVRGDVEHTAAGLHGTVTCEHSSTVVTRSCITCQSYMTQAGSAADQSITVVHRENNSQSVDSCTTSSKFQGVTMSSSGILSRGFMTAGDHNVGLASVLDPNPSYLTSCHERQQCDIRAGCPSGHSGDSQCQVMKGTLSQGFQITVDPLSSTSASVAGPNPTSVDNPQSGELHCPSQRTSFSEGIATLALDQHSAPVLDANPCSKNLYSKCVTVQDLPGAERPADDNQIKDNFHLCRATSVTCPSGAKSVLQRPSDVLQSEGDLDLVFDTSVMSPSFRQPFSPLCCGYCRPLTKRGGISSTPASTTKSAAFLPHSGSSLYDELLPYLSDESEDVYSSGIATDDEY